MYDDLSRIERIYGSVAEYNRVRNEEDYREPTLEESIESEVNMRVYNEKVRLLTGIMDEDIDEFNDLWRKKRPESSDTWSMKDVYASQDYSRNRLFDLIDKLSDKYGIESGGNFYNTESNRFSVSVEYTEHSEIKALSFTNMDYDTFKGVFSDFYFACCNPTMNYCDRNGKPHIISNSSLGSLMLSDLKWCGVETDDSIKEKLDNLGFDEKEFKEQTERFVMAEKFCEMPCKRDKSIDRNREVNDIINNQIYIDNQKN